MGQFTVGTIVLITFPFSDLSGGKKRPAIIIADTGKGDYLLLQITSKSWSDINAIKIQKEDYSSGSLPHESYIRPGKIFTGNIAIIISDVASVKKEILRKTQKSLISLIKNGGF